MTYQHLFFSGPFLSCLALEHSVVFGACKKINQKFESIVTMKYFNHEFISLPIYKIVLMTATGITCQNSLTFPDTTKGKI